MPVFKPRNRLVNFRLSEEEFEKLRAGCHANGARSMSDFARDAVINALRGDGDADPSLAGTFASSAAVQALAERVSALEHKANENRAVPGAELTQ